MESKELNELMNITKGVKINKKTYFFLAEDQLDGVTGTWGWNNSLEKVKDYFLYIFILGFMYRYNEEHGINKVSTTFIESVIYDMIMDPWDVTETEDTFFDLWKDVTVCETYKNFTNKANDLCNYLSSIGYKLNFKTYKNMKKAIKEAPYLIEGLDDKEKKLIEWLKKE